MLDDVFSSSRWSAITRPREIFDEPCTHAIHNGHADIHQDLIGLKLGHLQGLPAVFGRPDLSMFFQTMVFNRRHEGLIIGYQEPDSLHPIPP